MTRLTGFVALGFAAVTVAACGSGRHPTVDTPADRAPITVAVAPVVARDTAERLEAGGVVAARQSAATSSRIVATITAVRVKAGDRIRAGDVLIILDAREVTAQTGLTRASAVAADKALARARTEQTVVEAEHRLATAWQKRIAALHARNSATDQEHDEADARLAAAAARLAGAQAGAEGAEAEFAAARAAVGVATASESYTHIRAPFDGLVTERLTDPGNLASPGVPLLRIEADGVRQVVVRVDEARAAYVRPGDRATIVIDDGTPNLAEAAAVDGTVAEVGRAIGADQRAFTVKVDVPPTVTARSGSFARVVFRGAPRRALLVPAGAIHRQGQVSSVFVVQDGVARLRLVEIGRSSSDGVEVLAGLDAGESVVTSPLAQLADGDRVVIGRASSGPRSTP